MTTRVTENEIVEPLAECAHSSRPDALEEGDLLLHIAGIMPASDFHPFVVRVARRFGLRGWVRHDAAGALIRAVGEELQLARFVRTLWTDAPASARIRSMDPEAILAETPPVGDRFVALVDEPVAHGPTEPVTLEHVA